MSTAHQAARRRFVALATLSGTASKDAQTHICNVPHTFFARYDDRYVAYLFETPASDLV